MSAEAATEQELFRAAVDETIAVARAQRIWRTQVRRAARDARVRARRLRDRANLSRERSLASRWNLWSVGVLAAPPETLPLSWDEPLDAEAAVHDAIRQCGEAAAQAGARAPVVRALCDVTRERLLRRDEEANIALSLTARMLDLYESEFEGDDPETLLLASACRRCAAACRRALVVSYADAGD